MKSWDTKTTPFEHCKVPGHEGTVLSKIWNEAGQPTGHSVRILLKDFDDLLLPAHVEFLSKVLPAVTAAREAHEATVLRRESESGDVAEVLGQELLIAA